MSSTGSDGNLPSDAALIGYAPIYYSSTSPGCAWVTCLDSVVRLRLEPESWLKSPRAEAATFWNFDGQGRYESQWDSYIAFPVYDPVVEKQPEWTVETLQPIGSHSRQPVLRVHGGERWDAGRS